jgi:hypothetical protein
VRRLRIGCLSLLLLAGCATEQPTRGERVRPVPASAEVATPERIAAVVRSQPYQASLKSCYERALKRAGRVSNGRIEVTVSIGASGTVERVAVRAPSRLESVAPCLRLAISHWVFPCSRKAYATSFPLVLRGH